MPTFTGSVNFPFTLFTFRSLSTHVGCLLATGFLGAKHLFVLLQYWCVSSHFLPFVTRDRVREFRMIATFSPRLQLFC